MLKLPSNPEELDALLASLSDAELAEILQATQDLEKELAKSGPRNDDELWLWCKTELNLELTRVAVCEGHTAPFQFLADVYFERTVAALAMANRGGSKTFLVAVLHWANARFKPGIESCTFGAVDSQSDKAYGYVRNWVFDADGNKLREVVHSKMKETLFRNRSKIIVLGSTPEQVNGPHPNLAHADEIELMRDSTWRESRNMTISGRTTDGKILMPQDILTSTRKGPSGRMQALIDEIEKAEREGYKPPRELYAWCIKETSAERPNCREAPEEARRARLEELGLDPCDLCDCDKIRKGEWDDGKPRLLSQVNHT